MRSRSNGGVIGAYALPTQNYANGVFFIHDAAIYNTGPNPIWPLGTGFIYSATGGTISTAVDNPNYKLHTFTANGTFTVATGSAYIEILLVGGGGMGGPNDGSTSTSTGGGGGGGGVVTLVSQAFVSGGTTFTVEVGQGAKGSTTLDYNSAIHEPKPSRVTSNAGHSYYSPGGSSGGGRWNGALHTPIAGGGGAYQASIASSFSGGVATSAGTGSPGSIYSNAYAGGNSTATNVSNHMAAGGGAGAMGPGYDALYGTDMTKMGAGGDGYLWSRTGYYYGAGGGGGRVGITSGWPNGLTPTVVAPSGLSGAGVRTSGQGGWAMSTGNSPGTAGLDGFGGGGGGYASYGSVATTDMSIYVSGGNGTVIFCYRYQ